MYSLTATGRFRYLHLFPGFRFSPATSPQGNEPDGSVSVGPDGALYGSTGEGGVFSNGLLYKVDRRGVCTNLYHYDIFNDGKSSVLAARNGDLYAPVSTYPSGGSVLRLSRDGSHSWIPVAGTPFSSAETATGEIILGTYDYQNSTPSGTLWRLNSSGAFESLASVGDYPRLLVPLADGSILCLTTSEILQVSPAGAVSVVHRFDVPFEGLDPNFLVVAQDGSYLGSTSAGGLERSGTVFRIVPSSQAYTVISHLPAPGASGSGVTWMKEVFPLRVAALAGNRPPIAHDVIVAADSLKPLPHTPGALPQAIIPVLRQDSDADRDPLTIVAVGSATHGTASLDFVSQKITYTASTTPVASDSFPYTIVDGSGGTATARVVIRANPTGHYSGIVSSPRNDATGDPGTEVGSLTLRVNERRALSGRLTLLGKTYRVAGFFDEINQFAAVLETYRFEAKSAGLQLWLRPNGAAWTVEATIFKFGLPYSATCPLNPPQS